MQEPKAKRKRIEEAESTKQGTKQISAPLSEPENYGVNNGVVPKRIETGFFSKIPPELFHHILKFLSSEVVALYVHEFCCHETHDLLNN